MKNYWIADQHSAFGAWDVLLPRGLTADDFRQFTIQMHEALVAEQIWTLPELADEASIYEQIVKAIDGDKSFYGRLYMLPFREYGIRISYFNSDNEIQTDYITDLGLLLSQLKPELSTQYGCEYGRVEVTPPLELKGIHFTPSPDYIHWFRVRLNSDIWFPCVYGYLNRTFNHQRVLNQDELFDNYALASLHTPRLNEFLERLYQLSRQFSAKWELVDYELVPPEYQPYVTETGIRLSLDENGE